jgi:N-acetyl-S-(2-succino)cysteine monooxygenase
MGLGLFVRPAGFSVAAWRHPRSQADANVRFRHFVEIAQTAERACFDMVFSADGLSAETVGGAASMHRMSHVVWIEPASLMAALAAVTTHIGLVCTASTTYEEPYVVARRFASIDHISGGRAGWNLVTTANPAAARNFSLEAHPPKAARYDRAREFVDVVVGLWDSWDEDAFIRDRESGVYFQADKMRVLNHAGEHFRVKGPLNVARSPQGRPVVVQAGASEWGRQLAAETAEVIFSASPTIEEGRAFYADVKGRMPEVGRDPDDLKVMPGIFVTVGRTDDEAREKHAELQSLIHPDVGVGLLSRHTGLDLTGLDIEGPFPELPEDHDEKAISRARLVSDLAKREGLNLRELAMLFADGRGHLEVCGGPVHVADVMEDWFTTGAADGFNVLPPVLPASLDDFVELVVPELRRRGLFRTQYEGTTLRGHLGLRVPRPGELHVRRAPKSTSTDGSESPKPGGGEPGGGEPGGGEPGGGEPSGGEPARSSGAPSRPA